MRYIFFFGLCILNLFIVLFLNGNINLKNVPLPPLGKFLNPFGGIWSSNVANETKNIELVSEFLSAPVEIRYDDRRVPHIFAQNLEDALFAQGYVQAQNRLFQMEFTAMASAGDLSSVLGKQTLSIDKEKRRRGMRFAAENAVSGWKQFPEEKKIIDRYLEGINTYIRSLKDSDLPFEYKLLDMKLSEWDEVKSALVFKYMSLTLAGRNDDIRNTNLKNALGAEDFTFLFPETEGIENPVIPANTPYNFDTLYGEKQDESVYFNDKILKAFYESKPSGVGSNSWGVSGAKTASGKTIFCNDPHLSLGLPSIWFEMHIVTPEFNSYGVSLPGMPGIMIGFNEDIAWGETNVGQDVEDLFLIKWVDASRTKYMLDGEEKEVQFRIEDLVVKGNKTIPDTVRYTYWGPVYHESLQGNHDLAMRWLAHDIPDKPEFMVFVDAMRSRDYNDYLQCTGNFITPAQNFGFASKTGDIALRVNGRFPAKFDQDGRFVEYGDHSANNWQKYIPRSQNPQTLNPERGFISSANQRSTDKDYPYYYTGKFENYRNRTINGKLTNMQDITVDDMKNMQLDAFSSKAADLVPLILRNLDLGKLTTEEMKAGFELLKSWDFQYRASQEAPTFFEILFQNIQKNTWDEIDALRGKMDVQYPKAWRMIELINIDPGNKYFDIQDTPNRETATEIIYQSFEEACQKFYTRKSQKLSTRWGEYRPLDIKHLTQLPALSVTNLPADGSPDVINAVGVSFGPSWRMIVSLEDDIKAYGIYPGGQSGNPGSKFYSNMINDWLKGNYYALRFVKSSRELDSITSQKIVLKPKK